MVGHTSSVGEAVHALAVLRHTEVLGVDSPAVDHSLEIDRTSGPEAGSLVEGGSQTAAEGRNWGGIDYMDPT